MRFAALLLAGSILLSCAPVARDTVDANDAPGADAAVDLPARPDWYSQLRALDLTGDGTVDTLVLRAQGTHTDSLTIAMSAVIDGDTVSLDEWQSSYELMIAPESVQRPGAARDAYLRASLDATLAEARTEPFADSTLNRAWIPRGEGYGCMDDAHHCIMSQIQREMMDSSTAGNAAIAPFDTVRARRIIDELKSTGRLAMVYSYGYESTVYKVWSALAGRFYTFRYCC